MDKKNIIARRVAQELRSGDVVNLGIGLPTLVANHVAKGIEITLHSENGIIGIGPAAKPGEEDYEIVNAGGFPVTVYPGSSFLNSASSFAIVRGGRVDVTVLGALQVDASGNLANWMVPGKRVPGMGGAMDLVVGAKKVIVAMEHTIEGAPKILQMCTYPLTAVEVVDQIITELGVMMITKDGILLTEIASHLSVEDVQAATAAKLIIPNELAIMDVQYEN